MIRDSPVKVLLIDNYDSFTYNLYQVVGSLQGVEVKVFRNDAISLPEIQQADYDCIILSPGPGNPANPRDFGICSEIITQLQAEFPILGVCLGHQGIGLKLDGRVINASRILHGKTSRINHNQKGIFEDIPKNIEVARYHSLILDRDNLPDTVEVTAETDKGEIMAIQHRKYPLFGVQFHPESFMTKFGTEILSNFITITRSLPQLIEV